MRHVTPTISPVLPSSPNTVVTGYHYNSVLQGSSTEYNKHINGHLMSLQFTGRELQKSDGRKADTGDTLEHKSSQRRSRPEEKSTDDKYEHGEEEFTEAADVLCGADTTESHSGPTSDQPAYEAGQSDIHNDVILAQYMNDCQHDWILAENVGLLQQNEIQQGIKKDYHGPCPIFAWDLLTVARRLTPNYGSSFGELDRNVSHQLRQRLNPANSVNHTGSCSPGPPASELARIIFTPYDQRSDEEKQAMDRNCNALVPSAGWNEARRERLLSEQAFGSRD